MSSVQLKFASICEMGVIALALLADLWASGSNPSQAQDGSLHNCPQAGRWAMSVWDGEDGTDTGTSQPLAR